MYFSSGINKESLEIIDKVRGRERGGREGEEWG
jgi:hypothetical protein